MYKIAFLVLLLLGAVSCASDPLRQTRFDTRESYRAKEFNGAASPRVMGLLTTMEKNSGTEYRRLLNDFIEQAVKRNRPEIHIIPYWEGLSTINNGGFTSAYAEMLKEYDSTGILNKATLKKLGDAMQTAYFIQPRLVNFQQKQSTRFSALGLTLFKTHETEIKIYIEIWDVNTGNIVWIGAGEASIANEYMRARAIPFEEVARILVEDLIQKMP